MEQPVQRAPELCAPVNGKRGTIPMPTDATFLNAIAVEKSSRKVVSSSWASALVESFFVGAPASR